MVRRLLLAAVLSLSGCDQYQCRDIPDHKAEHARMDDLVSTLTSGQVKPSPQLKRARKVQLDVDDQVRRINAEHGCHGG